jgi:hypothetical protein
MKHFIKSTLAFALGTSSLTGFVTTAFAQDTSAATEATPGDIIVTARRREEALQDRLPSRRLTLRCLKIKPRPISAT